MQIAIIRLKIIKTNDENKGKTLNNIPIKKKKYAIVFIIINILEDNDITTTSI